MRSTFMDPMYPVKYKGRPCLPPTCMSSRVTEMRAKLEKIWRLSALLGAWMSSTCVANTSASAKASRWAFQVFLDSLRSSYNVILARILANWVRTSEKNGYDRLSTLSFSSGCSLRSSLSFGFSDVGLVGSMDGLRGGGCIGFAIGSL